MAAGAAVRAIFRAAELGQADGVVRMLADDPRLLSAQVGSVNLLMTAASKGHVGLAKLLLGRGAEVDARNDIGYTALHFAARWGHEDVVETLISSGADISRRDVNGWTALMHASIENHLAVVRFLLEHLKGRRLDDGNCHGRTAFWWACSNGHTDIARVLLLAGADHTVADYDGTTPREEAEAEERYHCVELIQASTARAVFIFKSESWACNANEPSPILV
jgi:serine/threonine-protein phosphatase 6 regulatory ankyrin repeat subunit B